MQSNGSDSSEQNQRQPQTTAAPAIQPVGLPQQWVPMQYPVTAMVMQHPHHHMLPPQHYVAAPPYMPYQYHQLPHVSSHPQQNHHNQNNNNNNNQGSNGGGDNKTIWVGDLHHWMDENYLHGCFASTGDVFFFFLFFFSFFFNLK